MVVMAAATAICSGSDGRALAVVLVEDLRMVRSHCLLVKDEEAENRVTEGFRMILI